MSYLDSQVGRIVDDLKERGLFDNTVIILTADHGEFLGDYGSYGKRSFLDAAARIPLIVSGPGFETGSRSEPVSLVDVYPTLLEIAGIDEPARAGSSLSRAADREAVYGQFQQGELGLYCVITDSWKYIYSAPDQREFLIDRVRDPRESQNVAYNVRARETLEMMRALATNRFPDLAGADMDERVGNTPLSLGAPPSAHAIAGLRALGLDRDSATLVVRGSAWLPGVSEHD